MPSDIHALIEEFGIAWSAMWQAHSDHGAGITKSIQPRFWAVHRFQLACNPAHAVQDDDLARVIGAWPTLDPEDRAAIMEIIEGI